jgi:MFS family permease
VAAPVRSSFVALRHRNFRLIWLGLLISFTGSYMQNAALLWHVSLLVSPGRKGLALGFVGLVRVLPIVGFSLISGVVADAWDRRKLMLFTQTSAAIVAGALALLTFRGLSSVWPIYALAALASAVGAFDMPARQALVPALVPREHLPNAISLNTIMLQLAAVGGPALAGIVIGVASVGWAYAFNALSFVCVIVALLMMRDMPARAPVSGVAHDPISFRAGLEGLRFVFRSPMIRSTMLLDFFATFFSSATALLPMFAQDILKVGASGYGWLYAAPAAGAVVSSAAMVPLTDRIEKRGPTLLWAVIVYGAATIVFGVSRSFWLTFACLAVTGAADTVSMIIRNIVRQLETPDHLRGRMTGVNMVFFMGGPQLGELEAGAVANWLGAPFSVISGGVGCLAATAWVAASTPALRQYRRTEHLPPAGTSQPLDSGAPEGADAERPTTPVAP